MFRLMGHVLPDHKSIWIGLTTIYGIWLSRSEQILEELDIPKMTKVKDLDDQQEKILSDHLKDLVLENDLKREKLSNIKRLKEIKCYRWMRHNLWLPVRGQLTRKNARTAKKLHGRSRVRPILKK